VDLLAVLMDLAAFLQADFLQEDFLLADLPLALPSTGLLPLTFPPMLLFNGHLQALVTVSDVYLQGRLTSYLTPQQADHHVPHSTP